MSTTKSILERVQCLPIELIREIKCKLDPETQIDLLKNKKSVYGHLNKTINQTYFKTYLIRPSMRALQEGLRKHSTKVHNTIQNKFGDFESSHYRINCELPPDVIQKMYYSNIRKPILKALKDAEKEAPVICDLDGKMKSCVTPLEKSIITRFKMLDVPTKPTYMNERSTKRYNAQLDYYYDMLSPKIYDLLHDLNICASFIDDLDYTIKMALFDFLKALYINSKTYIRPIKELLTNRTPEDNEIDKNREAYYLRNKEHVMIQREQQNMREEDDYMSYLMVKEKIIREKEERKQRKILRDKEKQERIYKKRERIYKKAQENREKALRASIREQSRARKLVEKAQKDTELVEKFTYKTIKKMFT